MSVLKTSGDIAKNTGTTIHVVNWFAKSLDVRPVGVRGITKLYGPEEVETISDAIAKRKSMDRIGLEAHLLSRIIALEERVKELEKKNK